MTGILARNLDGDEITVTVITRADLICITTSDGRDLIMPPCAAAELVMAILQELGGRLVPPRPLSGSF
jgi:hypothetical protein